MAEKSLLLDLHIPYGITPIRYLGGMQASGSNAEKDAYLEAMKREISSYESELSGYEIKAVRLSGGAATVMNPDLLGQVLNSVRKHLPLAPQAEISLDALPNTIGTPSLSGIAAGKPNRVELMIRSYCEEELSALACPFTLQHIKNALLYLNRFHMNNLGLTINYGIPGQTLKSWLFTVRSCANLSPAHITLSPLAVTDAPGMPSEEERFAMFAEGASALAAAGYQHYGAGLFCRSGCEYLFEALEHNDTDVLGLGANALSRMDGFLTRSTNNLNIYLHHAGDFEKTTAEVHELSSEETIRNYAAARLGMAQGLSRAQAESRFGAIWSEPLVPALEKLQQLGWITESDEGYLPTSAGFFHNLELSRLLIAGE